MAAQELEELQIFTSTPPWLSLVTQSSKTFQLLKRTPRQIEAIETGRIKGQLLCNFHDSLVNNGIAMNYTEFQVPALRENYPMAKLHDQVTDHLLDSFNLAVSLQRHKCKCGLCLRQVGGELLCKYNYPKELNPVTHLKFSRKLKKDGTHTRFQVEIIAKRVNDTHITNFSQFILKYLRVNHDFTVIFDESRIVNYITKYQTKPEKNSDVFESAMTAIFTGDQADNLQTQRGL
jgi:hypothetical protein